MLAVGFAAVAFLGAPVWFPMAFALALIGVQFAVNPLIIEWLVPGAVVPHDGTTYATDHPVGEIVARRCRQAGIPMVKLGIVDDGTPNAFTFGRTQRDARMWLTRGLLERLDERELDAVVAHEVGHVKHWDFVVMTLAAVAPMTLYLVYVIARSSGRNEARAVSIGAYVAYLVSQFTLLALARAREYGADHWSCEATGDGDALASALVKVAYGMGRADAERKDRVAALRAQGKLGIRQAGKVDRNWQRSQSMRAMGIFDPRQADAISVAFDVGIDPHRAVAAIRWDVLNPWGRTLEKLSSHPLVARRIEALDRSGLPGAPRAWSVLANSAVADADPVVVSDVRRRYRVELVYALAPWFVLVPMAALGAFTGSALSIGLALTVAGGLFVLKQAKRYPGRFTPVEEVAGLLERLDAGPVAGIPVILRGTIIGRGMPGYVLSPDLVIQDPSGFVPMLYRQPLPFARAWFGLFRTGRWFGQDVVATGWYRRMPGPVVELKHAEGAPGRARTWEWVARTAAAWLLVAAGVVVMLVGLAA
ncbi:MAG: M48 family metalloprotease [Actinobacteria bacterium]|nr:M48 family metalloprotease [Actinomycetota bacterium]